MPKPGYYASFLHYDEIKKSNRHIPSLTNFYANKMGGLLDSIPFMA